MNPDNYSAEDPTLWLATPDVGGIRTKTGENRQKFHRPAPLLQGTQREEFPLGCSSKSGRAVGESFYSSFLDSYKNNRNNFCGKWSVSGKIEDKGKQFVQVVRLGCKRWSCGVCGPKRATKLRYAIIREASKRRLQRFLTLTLDPRYCTPEESTVYMRNCWNKMRTCLKRQCGESIDFITVLEFQKSGYAHLHILVDRYIPQPWIQKSWQAVGGGRFVNIKLVDIHRVSAYLSKYLTKELLLADYRPGTRRYSTSRSIKLFVRVKKGLWELIRQSIDSLGPPSGIPIAEIKCDEDGVLQWFRIEIKHND